MFPRHRFNSDSNECNFCHWNDYLIHVNERKKKKKNWKDIHVWLSLKYVVPDIEFKTIKYAIFSLNFNVNFWIIILWFWPIISYKGIDF